MKWQLMSAGMVLSICVPSFASASDWGGFFKPQYNGRAQVMAIGDWGNAPTPAALAVDFERATSKFFRNDFARQDVVLTGVLIRPDLVTDNLSVAALLRDAVTNKQDARITSCQEAVNGKLLRVKALRTSGENETIETARECDPDEWVVQLRGYDGQWVVWFSLKCGNPVVIDLLQPSSQYEYAHDPLPAPVFEPYDVYAREMAVEQNMYVEQRPVEVVKEIYVDRPVTTIERVYVERPIHHTKVVKRIVEVPTPVVAPSPRSAMVEADTLLRGGSAMQFGSFDIQLCNCNKTRLVGGSNIGGFTTGMKSRGRSRSTN